MFVVKTDIMTKYDWKIVLPKWIGHKLWLPNDVTKPLHYSGLFLAELSSDCKYTTCSLVSVRTTTVVLTTTRYNNRTTTTCRYRASQIHKLARDICVSCFWCPRLKVIRVTFWSKDTTHLILLPQNLDFELRFWKCVDVSSFVLVPHANRAGC